MQFAILHVALQRQNDHLMDGHAALDGKVANTPPESDRHVPNRNSQELVVHSRDPRRASSTRARHSSLGNECA